ncbi:MAG: PLP-dependent aspartate aminotransferase family protein [Patescibacteria group bacterium]
MDFSDLRLDTRAIHTGDDVTYRPNAGVLPAFRTTTGVFDDADDFETAMAGGGHVYGRLPDHNPNHRDLQQKLAALEGGAAALVFSSGMAAITCCLLGFLGARDEVIAQEVLYSGTYDLLTRDFRRLGIPVYRRQFYALSDIAPHFKPQTSCIFIETPSNPLLEMTDLRGFGDLLEKDGIITIVDGTFATPYNQRLIEKFRIPIAIHSTTKYLNGHGDIIGGVAIFSEEFTRRREYAAIRSAYATFGAVPSPADSRDMTGHLDTFGLRMARHNRSGATLARMLARSPRVERVYYPGLARGEAREIVELQLTNGCGGTLSFTLHDGAAVWKKFVNVLCKETFVKGVVSLGSPKTHICRPAGTTHRQCWKEMGIPEFLLRVSVGLEDTDDILDAFKIAFNAL